MTQSFLGKLERGEHAPQMHRVRRLIKVLAVRDVGRFVRLAVLASVPTDLRDYCRGLGK